MFNIQPIKITADGKDRYKVSFIRVKNNSEVEYTFSFGDDPRGLEDYDKEYYFDVQDDPAETWLSKSLLRFDKARQLGVKIENDKKEYLPVALELIDESESECNYRVTFDDNDQSKNFSFTVTGNSQERQVKWEFGSCKTWYERGQFRFADNSPTVDPIMKAVLRFHEARNFESEVKQEV